MEQADHPHILQKTHVLYLSDSRLLLEKLREAIHTGDAAGLHAGAHHLKTARAKAGAIERRADQQRLDKVANLLAPPEESVELARRWLEDRIRRHAT